MAGQVVHARRGCRESYPPLRSLLCGDAAPCLVVEGLLGLYPFATIYIADLDALMGKPPQERVLNEIVTAFPGIVFWLDRGLPVWAAPNVIPVIGSESLNEENLGTLERPDRRFILSLDFRGGEFLGPPQLLTQTHLWPERIILMNLSHVGANEGPDFAGGRYYPSLHSGHRFVAAGGVRGAEDLEKLHGMGMTAALVASALHSGVITRQTLEKFGAPGSM